MQHERYDDEDEVVMEHDAPTVATVPPKKDRFLPISILIAAVLICGAILFSVFYRPGSSAPAPTIVANTSSTAPTISAQQVMTLGSRDAVLGSPSAPVTLIEYGDYQCPFCGEFFSQTEPQIVSEYISTGKVKMVFRDFPFLGPESVAAGEAAACAEDQNQLWAYHDALYAAKVADVAKGGSEDDGFFNTTEFLALAQQVHLNIGQFTTCVNSNADASIVTQEKTNAEAAGVDSTPTFFIDGSEIVDSTGASVGANGPAILQAIATEVLKH